MVCTGSQIPFQDKENAADLKKLSFEADTQNPAQDPRRDSACNHDPEPRSDTGCNPAPEPTRDTGQPVDGGCIPWSIVGACFILKFIEAGMFFSLGMLVPEIANHFNTGRAEAGMVIGLLCTVTYMLGPLVAFAIKAYGLAAATALGATLSIVGWIAAGVSIRCFPSLPFLYLSLGLVAGAGYAFPNMIPMAVVPLFFDRKTGIALGITLTGSGAGQMVIPRFIESSVSSFGLGNMMVMVGAAHFLLFISVIVFHQVGSGKYNQYDTVDDKDVETDKRHSETFSDDKVETDKRQPRTEKTQTRSAAYRDILRAPEIVLLLCFQFLVAISTEGGLTYNADRAAFLGRSKDQTVYLLGVCGITMVIGRLVVGMLIDILRSRIFSVVTVTMTMYVVTSSFSDYMRDFSGQCVWFVIYALGYSFYMIGASVILRLIGGDKSTECFGLWNVVRGLASLLSTGIIGHMFDTYGSYRGGYLVAGGLSMVGVLLLPLVYFFHNKKTRL